MKLYSFVCKNITNIWAGIGAGRWAVSDTKPSTVRGRKTRAKNIRKGEIGIIYCSHESYKSLTTPFIFSSTPELEGEEIEIWPERWIMPFSIRPLGSPRKHWNAKEAARRLPFNAKTNNQNVSSVFKLVGTAVFSPLEIGADDWSMILEQLAED